MGKTRNPGAGDADMKAFVRFHAVGQRGPFVGTNGGRGRGALPIRAFAWVHGLSHGDIGRGAKNCFMGGRMCDNVHDGWRYLDPFAPSSPSKAGTAKPKPSPPNEVPPIR